MIRRGPTIFFYLRPKFFPSVDVDSARLVWRSTSLQGQNSYKYEQVQYFREGVQWGMDRMEKVGVSVETFFNQI